MKGNAFCKKVTYRAGTDPETGKAVAGDDADSVLASFRNDYYPRIAVTVDMIATGTDVKPLEVLLFMRDVRSRGYYEQMKGRGVRSLGGEALKKVTGSAEGAKTHFVLIDAVGVEKTLKTESRPLERKPTLSLDSLLKGVAYGDRPTPTPCSASATGWCVWPSASTTRRWRGSSRPAAASGCRTSHAAWCRRSIPTASSPTRWTRPRPQASPAVKAR